VKTTKSIGTPSRTGKANQRRSADQMDEDWEAHNDTLSSRQRFAVERYSESGYESMNALLRRPADGEGDRGDKSTLALCQDLQAAMAPAPKGQAVFRGLYSNGLGLGSHPSEEEVKALEGGVLVSDAFVSTSVNPNSAFSGDVKVEIEVPKGTPSLWVKPNSAHPGEDELLLAAGSKIKIISVEVTPASMFFPASYKVKARIVP
jgi:hypothetical protein